MLMHGPRAGRQDLNCADCGCELHYFLLGAQSNEENGYWACPRCQPGLCHMLERWPSRRKRIPLDRAGRKAHPPGSPDASGSDLPGPQGRGARPEEARRFTTEEVACLVLLALGAAVWALSRYTPLLDWFA